MPSMTETMFTLIYQAKHIKDYIILALPTYTTTIMKTFFIYILLFCSTTIMYAQWGAPGNFGNQEKKDFSVEAYKKGLEEHVRNGAELTPQECEKLFPLIHEMIEKKKELSDQQRALYKGLFNKDITDSEYEAIINKSLDYDIQINKLEKSYYKKFHTIISWKKVFKVRHHIYTFQMGAMHRFNRKPQTNNNKK